METSSNRIKANKASAKKSGSKRRAAYKPSELARHLNEPEFVYTSKIRAIGNSNGVILNNRLIETAGLTPDQDILIQASEGIITIMRVKETGVNSDLSSWDKQFKSAIRKGAKPESNPFAGIENEFDLKEW